MDLSIIIINYNTAELTKNCIRSIIEFTKEISYEIILVDNGSSESEPEIFKKEFPSITLIKSEKNLGFAKGNNLGLKDAKGKYAVLFNSDAFLKENSFKKLAEHLNTNPSVAVVSPRVVSPDGSVQYVCHRFPSVRVILFELFRLQKIIGKRWSSRILLSSFFNNDETIKVDWVWGTCFAMRLELLKKLPGQKLDDDYFMYYEDVQWCSDFKKLGYEIHFYAETEIVHMGGASSGKATELMNNAAPLYFKKNYNLFHTWMIGRAWRILQLSQKKKSNANAN